MDSYRVIVAPKAFVQLDKYIDYIQHTLLNEQAAKAVYEDAIECISDLANTAGILKLCDNPRLKEKGYRVKHFSRHRYVIIYLIEGSNVYVEAIYHELQDYESIIAGMTK